VAKYEIVEQELYLKAYKKLSKKYRNIDNDLEDFFDSITSKTDLGIELKANIYKIRIANSSKNRGKSAGFRLISYLKIINNELHLLYIYDKSELENISEQELDRLILQQL